METSYSIPIIKSKPVKLTDKNTAINLQSLEEIVWTCKAIGNKFRLDLIRNMDGFKSVVDITKTLEIPWEKKNYDLHLKEIQRLPFVSYSKNLGRVIYFLVYHLVYIKFQKTALPDVELEMDNSFNQKGTDSIKYDIVNIKESVPGLIISDFDSILSVAKILSNPYRVKILQLIDGITPIGELLSYHHLIYFPFHLKQIELLPFVQCRDQAIVTKKGKVRQMNTERIYRLTYPVIAFNFRQR